MEENQTIDLRIYELCKNKLRLTESDATAVSKDLQALVEEERSILLKQYLDAERDHRKSFEEFLEIRVELLRQDVQNMHIDLAAELKSPPNINYHADILQWMFTYFAFLMGGLVAVLLLLLKK